MYHLSNKQRSNESTEEKSKEQIHTETTETFASISTNTNETKPMLNTGKPSIQQSTTSAPTHFNTKTMGKAKLMVGESRRNTRAEMLLKYHHPE